MQLLAIAGGSFGGEEVMSCCGMYILLPLVLWLSIRGVVCNSGESVGLALVFSVLPYFIMMSEVARYQPSEDGDVMADQAIGRETLVFCGWMVGIAVLSAVCLVGRRLIGAKVNGSIKGSAPDVR